MDKKKLKELSYHVRENIKFLATKRRSFITEAKEVSKYICPERGRFNNNNSGLRNIDSVNAKANKYLHNLASILQSGLTSPARQWFKLSLPTNDLYEWGEVKKYLTDIENIIDRVFRITNFYPAIFSAYVELIAYGNVVMSSAEDTSVERLGLPTFTTYTAGQWLIDQDEMGRVTTVYRTQIMRVKDIVKRFENSTFSTVKKLAEIDQNTQLKIIHAVEKRDGFDSKKIDKFNMPYSSVWILDSFDDNEDFGILDISGFNEMPYFIARWDVVNDDPYGFGPGIRAVKDAKSLNLLDQIATYGLNKAVNPPILVPSYMNLKLNNMPGGITYYTSNASDSQIKPLYTVSSDLGTALTFMTRWESILKEIFQNDLFIYMMNRSNLTATEISERSEEKLLLLGPVLERIQTELLTPCFDRVYNILDRNNLLPPAPPELIGMDIKPEFIGMLAQAQKTITVNAVNNVIRFVANAASIDPSAIDKLDIDQAIDIYSSIQGAPNGVIRSDDETLKIRDEKNKNTASSQTNTIESSADIDTILSYAKKLSDINLSKNSALNKLLEG